MLRFDGERTPGFKLALVIVVGLVLTIPLFSIYLLNYDRQSQMREATASITGGWGDKQAMNGPLRARGQLEIHYKNGRVEYVPTDRSWRVDRGPVTYNDIYGGEDYDARLWPDGWDSPGFDDSKWPAAVELVRPAGQMRGHSAAAPPLADRRRQVGRQLGDFRRKRQLAHHVAAARDALAVLDHGFARRRSIGDDQQRAVHRLLVAPAAGDRRRGLAHL